MLHKYPDYGKVAGSGHCEAPGTTVSVFDSRHGMAMAISSVTVWQDRLLIKLDVGQDEFDIAAAIISIDMRMISNVEELAIEQFFIELGH